MVNLGCVISQQLSNGAFMKAIVDKETCIGCGLCVQFAPDIFRMEEDDIAATIVDEVPDNKLKETINAADKCPVNSITVS